MFPEKEKYETSVVKESWPTFNQEFTFMLQSPSKYYEDHFRRKFISFTVYAVLGNSTEPVIPKNSTSKLKRFFSFNNFGETNSSFRHSLNNPRTVVGTVTFNLDPKIFTQKLDDDMIFTPYISRGLKGMQTELVSTKTLLDPIQRQFFQRDGKNGSVEMTLLYAIGEDRRNDVITISITKYRCGMQTMQQHEKLGGQLYIKIKTLEPDDLIQKMNSVKFDPTISLKFEASTATLRVNNYNLKQVKISVKLICKNLLGKKVPLGKIKIDSNSDLWKETVSMPFMTVKRMVKFE
jgi:hypothetical protein